MLLGVSNQKQLIIMEIQFKKSICYCSCFLTHHLHGKHQTINAATVYLPLTKKKVITVHLIVKAVQNTHKDRFEIIICFMQNNYFQWTAKKFLI